MAHESFENEAIAQELNVRFVNIKVDREERPDVDRIYMAYVQSLTGGGGWPMSVWLTPDLKPIYGGTYFPPENRYGRIGFSELIVRISSLWSERRDELVEQGSHFVDTLNAPSERSSSERFDMEVPNRCLEELVQQFDPQWGGFGAAPKFPMPSYLSFLLESADTHGLDEGNKRSIGETLDRMSEGGIWDALAGGFHRYSVDRYWHVPHFEKMLYDQGQLAVNYADASRTLSRIDFLTIAQNIALYVGEQLRSELGGFYSAEDADSPLPSDPSKSGEGAFYVWDSKEIDKLLSEENAAVFKAHFGVEDSGNVKNESDPHGDFKGLNVLMRKRSLEAIAESQSLELGQASAALQDSIRTLKEIRSKRPRPHLDDKILASWNGFMISGACKVYQSGGDESCLELAVGAGEFIICNLYDESENRLFRSFRMERGNTNGFAEDYASVALAFTDLYESTGQWVWLERAERLMNRLIDSFWDESGHGFFATEAGETSLIARLKDDYDGAEPSANSMAALAALKLAALLGDARFEKYAVDTINAFRYQWSRAPRAMPLMLVALIRAQSPAQQIIIAGRSTDADYLSMQEISFAERCLHSHLIYLNEESDWLKQRNPHLSEFGDDFDVATAYVCENYTCQTPATNAELLESQLKR